MIPVFYINLDTRPERRTFMERQFADIGIVAERVPATPVNDVPHEILEDISQPGHLWRVTPGDIACGLSHQHVWRLMLSRGLEETLVMEDDAVIDPAIRPYLEPGLLARHQAGLIRLETRRQPVALGGLMADATGIRLRELGSTHKGTAAYLISRAVAEFSLQHRLVNAMAVDRFLFGHSGPHLYRTRILQADPAPVVQLDRTGISAPEARSDISDDTPSGEGAKRPRHRRWQDVAQMELGLLTPRLSHMLRNPGMLPGRRPVTFAGDKDQR